MTWLGKTIAIAEDLHGFIVNRVLMSMIGHSMYALHEGETNPAFATARSPTKPEAVASIGVCKEDRRGSSRGN